MLVLWNHGVTKSRRVSVESGQMSNVRWVNQVHQQLIPPKLRTGDCVAIVSPSCSGAGMFPEATRWAFSYNVND
jgi:hypothetical protein